MLVTSHEGNQTSKKYSTTAGLKLTTNKNTHELCMGVHSQDLGQQCHVKALEEKYSYYCFFTTHIDALCSCLDNRQTEDSSEAKEVNLFSLQFVTSRNLKVIP